MKSPVIGTFKEQSGRLLQAFTGGMLTWDEILAFADRTGCYKDVAHGYVMDCDLIAELGLSTKRVIYVSGNTRFSTIKAKSFKISFLHQKNSISPAVIPYLQLLDTLLLLKNVPRVKLKAVLEKYQPKILGFSQEERKLLVNLARKYTPFARVMLCVILRNSDDWEMFSRLLVTINPKVYLRYNLFIEQSSGVPA